MPDCPALLRPQLLSTLSEASRQAGWLSFDLKQFDHAGYYYQDARTLAHEAENTGLGALVLCEMSSLATWQSKPRIGIDHAVVASHQLGLDLTAAQVRHQLADGGLTRLVDELLAARAQQLLLVVDQFEELLTQTTPAARAQIARPCRTIGATALPERRF